MNINNEIPTTSMNTVIVPLMGENWNLIQEAITSFKPHRVILCHSLSRRDLLHTNSLLLENHLTQLHKDLDIETVSLNCSEYPLALGESFAGMLRNDFNGLNNHDQTKASYNVLITQDTPLGYFLESRPYREQQSRSLVTLDRRTQISRKPKLEISIQPHP